jgi:SAM-dependent MidA family methyltransferase
MTPAGRLLAQEIAEHGPIQFSRFMEVALYHPQLGYYRGPRHPIGRHGDFFTAAQLQPVFGTLIAAYLRPLASEIESIDLVELGAAREEMRDFFRDFHYMPLDLEGNAMPARFRGIVFSNEFFDALPVDLVVSREGKFHDLCVTFTGTEFKWIECGESSLQHSCGLTPGEDGTIIEVNTEALSWMDRINAHLESGFIFSIDYGYRRREAHRFPAGTLMSYRRHTAVEDVLLAPGLQDITSHVCFSCLENHGKSIGLENTRSETLQAALLRAGDPDQFRAALQADLDETRRARTLQLKTLVFGMGETFQTLLQRKPPTSKNGPEVSGP